MLCMCIVCGGVAGRRDAVAADDQSVGTETGLERQQLSGKKIKKKTRKIF